MEGGRPTDIKVSPTGCALLSCVIYSRDILRIPGCTDIQMTDFYLRTGSVHSQWLCAAHPVTKCHLIFFCKAQYQMFRCHYFHKITLQSAVPLNLRLKWSVPFSESSTIRPTVCDTCQKTGSRTDRNVIFCCRGSSYLPLLLLHLYRHAPLLHPDTGGPNSSTAWPRMQQRRLISLTGKHDMIIDHLKEK